ncbi:MAG: nucleoside kinase, partial [Lachnospiraceae bacterium]|nr:nucleoside kinase [Lachnospiraceae bacterium]
GGAEELMLLQEAFLEKKIGDVAEEIAKSGKKIVMIAGPSSSGKTTFSIRLSIQLMAQGLRPHPIACDDFFRNRAEYPIDPETGEADFEALDCVDREFLTETLERLLRGEKVDLPTYNFTVGEREFRGKTLKLGPEDVIILEGIHCLNDALTPGIEADRKYRIYISALTQLNIDEHNRIPTTDGRLLRRIVRDAKTRGYSAQDTISRWESVRRGEEKNIFPYQESCDVMVNSALIYELSVLKPYAEPLLYSVPKTSPEYVEAKRLLKFLDYFLAIPSEQVPKNSIMREFIGGSLFDV